MKYFLAFLLIGVSACDRGGQTSLSLPPSTPEKVKMSEIMYCEFGTNTRFSEEVAAEFLRITKSPPLEGDWTSRVIDESVGECLSVDGEVWRWDGAYLIDPNSRRVWDAKPTQYINDALHGAIHELIAATHKSPTTKVLSDAFDVALAKINH